MELFHIDAELKSCCMEASEEDVQALAELHEDPINDAQIELYIYLCLLRFRKSKDTKHLEQAIQRAEGWVAVTPAHHPDYNRRCSIFNTVTIWGHQRQAIMKHLEATALEKQVRDKLAIKEIDIQVKHLHHKASSLQENFKQHGRLKDLDEAVEAIELATSIAGDYITPLLSLSLGKILSQRFAHAGSMDDLDRAISIVRNAADATTHDDLSQPEIFNYLGAMLGARAGQTGSIDDLNQAVSIINDAVDATPCDHPNRVAYLDNLGIQLGNRFNRIGLIDDLNQAVKVASDAVDATPDNSPNRALYLNNLGSSLFARFEHIGLMDDLDRAVIVVSNALDATPHNSLKRAVYLANLGIFLGKRFQQTESISDLDQAINAISDAVDAMPYNHPFQWMALNNLGTLLSLRFEQTGSIDDLNRTVGAVNDALDRTPYDHLQRAACLSNLGVILGRRFEQTGLMDDIDRAISVSSDAVEATPHDHPGRVRYLHNLGINFGLRFKQLGSTDDLNRQLSSCIASWDCIDGPPSIRIRSAQLAAEVLILQQDWEKAYQLLHNATSLLPTMSPRSLNHTDTQAMLNTSNLFGLTSLAAAVALHVGKTPGDALRLLELGRGVIASLLMDMRGDFTELQLKHPDLAEMFNLLREELDSSAHNESMVAPDRLSSWEIQIKRRREADGEFSKIIDEIRSQPGFSQFLQPPAAEELMSAANQGPIIVVNISSFRSDAFLVRPKAIQAVVLPGITHDELVKQMKDSNMTSDYLSSSLEWLWHTICRPCLDALGFTDPVSDGNWPHVWWIPTGLLSQMPLHAAGIYKHASKETVLDRVVSSYASSIKALLHGRKRSIQKSSQAASLDSSALIVAMQDTPGLGQDARLLFANSEMNMLQGLCPTLQLTPSMPRRKDDVLKQLPKCKLFHFAGHGRLNLKNPSQSCLLLEDWETNPLTAGAVRDSWLQDNPPFLAYLSACSTGANKAAKLADEGIHLISAFQLAGFQHVIGTLWEVSDKHCVDVARILYKTLQEEGMTDEAVSRGLHRAVRALRDGVTEENTQGRDAKLARRKPEAQRVLDFLWVPYIHFGV